MFDIAVWNEKQVNYIQKLEKTIDSFVGILDIDPKGLVLGGKKTDINNIIEHNKKLLCKLKNQEFSIAVVGLEKAGKSTLSNALLGYSILPEYTQRCTYTTTRIEAGNNDVGTVEFYSKGEFEKNFEYLLGTLKFNEQINFEDLSLEYFDDWWLNNHEKKQTDIYHLYRGTIYEDIKKMLNGKEIILDLLDKESLEFKGQEKLKSSEFVLYITGIQYGSDGKKVKGNGPHPYAVKNVSIKSTNLLYMKNSVLYDVPGFDSPTNLHKQQTEEMLKKADAIILVTNVGDRPDLNGPQIDMLCQVRDEDGILLHDKCFVFGNKIDMAGNFEIASDNIAVLKEEAEFRYDIAKSNRIICGSAKAYLESIGEKSADEKARGVINVDKKIQEWGLSNGVDELRKVMDDYYHEERYLILQQRVNNSLKSTEALFRDILEKTEMELNKNAFTVSDLTLKAKNNVYIFKDKLRNLIDSKILELKEKKIFTLNIVENLNDLYPKINKNDPVVLKTMSDVARDIDYVFHSKYVDSQIRQNLYRNYLKKAILFSDQVVKKYNQSLNNEIIDLFLKCLDIKTRSEKVLDSVRKLFESLFMREDNLNFNSLIERFNTNVVETIIALPFGSLERFKKVTKENIEEFISLAAYYKKSTNSKNVSEYKFENSDLFNIFSLVLTHLNFSKFSELENTRFINDFCNDISNNSIYIPENLNEMKKQMDKEDGDSLILSYISIIKEIVRDGHLLKNISVFSEKGIVLTTIKDLFIEYFCSSVANNLRSIHDEKKEFVEELVKTFSENHANITSFSKIIDLFNKYSALEIVKADNNSILDEDKYLSILNSDIDLLIDITKNALCELIGLERSVISNINNNIELLCLSIESKEHCVFDKWINENLDKIYTYEFKKMESESEQRFIRKNIMDKINHSLNSIII